MQRSDCFGQDTTTTSLRGLASWNAAQMAFLAHGAATPAKLAEALEADPDLAIAHATKGLFLLLLGRSELLCTARAAHASAVVAADKRSISQRENTFLKALSHWLAGRPSHAVRALDDCLIAHPDDALAMKLSHAIRFILGDADGMRRSLETVMPSYADDHPALGYVYGCYAFALEETGDYDAAKKAGSSALERSPDDAWGLHAVAHVYDMTGKSRDGLNWLSGREAAWSHCNNFRYHVWWHKALMHLDQGEIDTVFDLYDSSIRGDRTDDYRDISNATSLLMRLELEGISVGERWQELAELSETRTGDGSLLFADLHYLLALIGDKREMATARMVARIAASGARGQTEADLRMASPGIAASEGLEAFSEGDFSRAFAGLGRARISLQSMGGSHAQRDVFERITIDAGIRAGCFGETLAMLDDRTRQRAGCDDRFAETRRALIKEGQSLLIAAE
ncbi:MAG: tetratricopeptide repeat protein [Pseudomonadota bacterium]